MKKKIFTQLIFCAMLYGSLSAQAQDSLFISELADPADDYSGRFIELFNAGSMPIDFNTLTFYLARQSNGGTSWGDVRLTGSVSAGETYVIGGSAFESLYGFAPDLVTGILIGNGDDAYCLFRGGDHSSGVLQDIFGEINVDGTGMAWEYTDSRASRVETILLPNITWTASEWEIITANIADSDPGTHHGSVNPGIDHSDFTLSIENDTVNGGQPINIPVSVGGLLTEDNIISYQFDVDFDNTVLEYLGYTLSGTLAEGGNIEVNTAVSGKLSVGYMNVSPLIGSGPILILQFNPLALDTTNVLLSNALLNNIPVENMNQGSIIISETDPPIASIYYNDSINRYADTLLITAAFSEAMDASNPVSLNLSGVVSLLDAAMMRLNDTVYNYLFPVPKAEGEVFVSLSGGTDLAGNGVVSVPVSGESFTIMGFNPGDVDDDGLILAYDAALTLQYSVGLDPLPVLDPLPWEYWRDSTANVDGSGGITAFDAGLILQYAAGIISDFAIQGKKSLGHAEVTIEVVDNAFEFYADGELIGLNIHAVCENMDLGHPRVLDANLMSAFNINKDTYNIGLCSAISPAAGSAFLRIPYNGSGSVTFYLLVNREFVSIDPLATGRRAPINDGTGVISVFPNPVRDRLFVGGLDGPADLRIYSIHGRELLLMKTKGYSYEMDLSGFSEGIYILVIETERQRTRKRILISRE